MAGAVTNMASPTVFPTMAPQGAPLSIVRRGDIVAPSVKAQLTVANHAHLSDLLCIITPLQADAWESTIQACNLYHIFADIPHSIRTGFDMGVHSTLYTSYTPPNHQSALNLPSIIQNHINSELAN